MSKKPNKVIHINHRQGMGHTFYLADFRTGIHKDRRTKRQGTRKQRNDRATGDE